MTKHEVRLVLAEMKKIGEKIEKTVDEAIRKINNIEIQ